MFLVQFSEQGIKVDLPTQARIQLRQTDINLGSQAGQRINLPKQLSP